MGTPHIIKRAHNPPLETIAARWAAPDQFFLHEFGGGLLPYLFSHELTATSYLSTTVTACHLRQRRTHDGSFEKILIRHCDTDRISRSMPFEEILAMLCPPAGGGGAKRRGWMFLMSS